MCSILLFFKVLFPLIHQNAEHLIKKISFPCRNARDVPVKFYICYIITSIVLSQLGYLLSILIVILS